MAVPTFTNLGASANPDLNTSLNQTSYANTSWTPPTTGIIVVFVVNTKGTAAETPTMSGNSLTWTQIVTTEPATGRRMTLFAATLSGATAGATTIDFGAGTQTSCKASFFQVENVDTSGGIAAAFVQSPTSSGTGTTGSVTLAAAGHADNRPIAGFAHEADEVTTKDAAWTEIDDMSHAGPSSALETQWDTDGFVNASASWVTSSAWIGIAAEIKGEQVTGPPLGGLALMGVGR